MSIISFNEDSLRRHNVTHSEILEVLADDLTMPMEFGQSHYGHPTVMYVGYTVNERMLEVGVEFINDGDDAEHVYHARSTTSHYAKLYKWRRS